MEFHNKILAALPLAEARTLRPHLTLVRLLAGQTLYEHGERIEHVFFIEHGFASLVAEADDMDRGVHIGLVGPESLVSLAVLLHREAAVFNRIVMQMSGVAFRMPASALRDSLDSTPVLRRLLLQASETTIAQIMQTVACNARHSLPRRLARWLLMCHDRAGTDELQLTHEFLAVILGVRRPAVSEVLATLQDMGCIQHRRRHILISNRPGLEAAACHCYGRVQAFAEAAQTRHHGTVMHSSAVPLLV